VGAQFDASSWRLHRAGRRRDQVDESFRHVDLDRADTVLPAVHDVDLVVSTVPHPSWSAERVVLEHGGFLVNCSHAPARVPVRITAAAKDPKGLVLLNAGLVPGVANLVAAELLERQPRADCLEVGFTVLSAATAGKAGGEFAHRGLTSRRRHRVVTLPMPEPFRGLKFIQTAEDEDGGFGGVADGRAIETYLGFADRPLDLALRAINSLRLMSALPRAAFAVDRGGSGVASREPTAVWVGARRGGERLGASMIECDGDYRVTAAAARIFGEALRDLRHRPGCFNPEDLFCLDDLLPAFEEVGLHLTRDWPVGAPAR
jgi:hypothetical protein